MQRFRNPYFSLVLVFSLLTMPPVLLWAGAIRIKLEADRRIFTPLARSSYAWKTLYKKRAALERVHSRLDVSFGFENHFIRGHKKMKLRCALAFIIMLAIALGRVKEKQREKLRSLVQAAA